MNASINDDSDAAPTDGSYLRAAGQDGVAEPGLTGQVDRQPAAAYELPPHPAAPAPTDAPSAPAAAAPHPAAPHPAAPHPAAPLAATAGPGRRIAGFFGTAHGLFLVIGAVILGIFVTMDAPTPPRRSTPAASSRICWAIPCM